MKPCNDVIRNAIDLAHRMAELADEGDLVREDAGCGVLFGVMRDSAFKIRRLAEEERESHMRKGWWRREDAAVGPAKVERRDEWANTVDGSRHPRHGNRCSRP